VSSFKEFHHHEFFLLFTYHTNTNTNITMYVMHVFLLYIYFLYAQVEILRISPAFERPVEFYIFISS